ncbi:MAG: hypothetical protein IPL50_11970 [Chitinophagaceae bacterium]|nr:hypothetical protein [Chitinophagaceae bacterium]
MGFWKSKYCNRWQPVEQGLFSDSQIEAALGNCYAALAENGLLAIIRNKLTPNGEEIEKSCIYQKQSNPAGFKKYSRLMKAWKLTPLCYL